MTKRRKKSELVSIVIPVYNEEENIPVLYDQLRSALQGLPYAFEVIFVDDGSTDTTVKVISQLHARDKRVKAVSFSRNFGHQAALVAGLDAAHGSAVITLDGDLQHPPRLIPELLREWQKGFDVVYTIRREFAGASSLKRATAGWFYRLLNRIGNIQLPPNTADFRLLSRPVVEQLQRLEERALFLRGLIQWVGFRQTAVEYDAERRFAGRTKYSWGSMLRFAADGITSFSNMPLIVSLYFGFIVSLLSFVYGIYAIYVKLFTNLTVPGWTSILVAVLFLGGVQLITLGIVGLYLGKLYEEVKHRPRYIVQSTVGDVGDVR